MNATPREKLAYGSEVRTAWPFEAAIARVKDLLKDEGFGVLCEVDVAATMREKLGESFRPYRILGACNPAFAHRALTAAPHIGLLLPCNVVVQELEGTTYVSAIDARAMLAIVGDPNLGGIAGDVNAALGRVLDRLAAEVPGR